MIKKAYLLLGALVSAAAAQQMSEYPTIYSPEANGPVPNPAYYEAQAQTTGVYLNTGIPTYRYVSNLIAGYGFSGTPHSKYAANVINIDLEGSYHITRSQALTLSASFATGGETNDYFVRAGHHIYPFTDSFDRTSFAIMGGYRYTLPLTPAGGVLLDLGGKCGLDVQNLDVAYGYGWHEDYYYRRHRDNHSHTQVGLAYAGYAHLRFALTPTNYFLVGYQFRGSTARPSSRTGDPMQPHYRTCSMLWHEVRVGISFRF